MQPEHTPGPWEFGLLVKTHNHPDRYWEAQCFSASGYTASGTGTTKEEAEANGHLIAAAPELLDALIGILELGRKSHENPKYDGYYLSAREAIAKARRNDAA